MNLYLVSNTRSPLLTSYSRPSSASMSHFATHILLVAVLLACTNISLCVDPTEITALRNTASGIVGLPSGWDSDANPCNWYKIRCLDDHIAAMYVKDMFLNAKNLVKRPQVHDSILAQSAGLSSSIPLLCLHLALTCIALIAWSTTPKSLGITGPIWLPAGQLLRSSLSPHCVRAIPHNYALSALL